MGLDHHCQAASYPESWKKDFFKIFIFFKSQKPRGHFSCTTTAFWQFTRDTKQMLIVPSVALPLTVTLLIPLHSESRPL